ncbi:hypothetical protein D3C71_1256040 [compost metagenome]
MRFQIDQHRTALNAVLGQVLNAQRTGVRAGITGPVSACMRVGGRCRDFHSGPKAVVEHGLGLAVAIGIEAAAHMRQAVPLGGVLRVHQQHVIANHVGKQRVF